MWPASLVWVNSHFGRPHEKPERPGGLAENGTTNATRDRAGKFFREDRRSPQTHPGLPQENPSQDSQSARPRARKKQGIGWPASPPLSRRVGVAIGCDRPRRNLGRRRMALLSGKHLSIKLRMNAKPMLLAAGFFLAAGLLPTAQCQPAVTPRQQAKTFEKKITVPARLEYLLSLPTDYGKSRKAWPLVLFLHGSGESGNDLNKVKVHGPPNSSNSTVPSRSFWFHRRVPGAAGIPRCSTRCWIR